MTAVATLKPKSYQAPLSKRLESERIVSLKEAAQLRGVSVDTLKRNDRDKIIKLSKRRLGVKLKDVLQLDDDGDATAA